uniref:Cytochrome P450 n=1 Tax=Timema cristinae TaxID=61476 RepID=A0A7R9GVM4_TIMCR|nr:unnamed protein product [Timema cristinae]
MWAAVSVAVAVGIATILAVLYTILTWNYSYWKKRGVPHIPPTLPNGNVKELIQQKLPVSLMYEKLYKELQGHRFGGVYRGFTPVLLLREPELIKNFLTKDFMHFHDRNQPVDEKKDPLGLNLFSLHGPLWRKLRMKLTPTFTSGKMKMMYSLITDCAKEMVDFLHEPANKGESIDIKEWIGHFSTDIIGSCAFGTQFNSFKDPNSGFRMFGRSISPSSNTEGHKHHIFQTCFPILKVMSEFYSLLSLKKKPYFGDMFIKMVTEVIEYREKNGIERKDFLQMLIKLKNKGRVESDALASKDDDHLKNLDQFVTKGNDGDIEMTDTLLVAQCFVFFLAGYETSSSVVSFCLHELALNPDIQSRLREEVDDAIEGNDGKLTYDVIQSMKYMDQIIYETLRKYPSVSNLERLCTKEYAIPHTDVTVEKGTLVMIPVYALHHDPDYFPDPEKFDPERFNQDNKNSFPQYAYLPFGEGPRICIGMRFGLMQVKVGLATLLSKYEFSISEKSTVPLILEPAAMLTTAKVACAVAEPPVDRQYLPPGSQEGDYSSPSSQYGVPSINSGSYSNDDGLSAEYGVPFDSPRNYDSSNSLSSEYGVPSSSSGSPSAQYNAPAPFTRNSGSSSSTSSSGRFSGISRPSSQYAAPSAASSRFGGASSASSRFGGARAPSNNYGAPSASSNRLSGASFGGSASASRFGGSSSTTSGSFSGASAPSSQYSAPSTGSSRFGGSVAPASGQFGGFSSPSAQYGAPSVSAGGLTGSRTPSVQYGTPSSAYGAPLGGYNANSLQEDPLAEPANYNFNFEVRDAESGAEFGQEETRQDESAKGSYHVLLPDGRTLIVEYMADEEGYKPTIRYEEPAAGYSRGGSNQGPYPASQRGQGGAY